MPLNAGYIIMFRHLHWLERNHEVFVITDDNPKARYLHLPCKGFRLSDTSKSICRRLFAKSGLEPLWTLIRARAITNDVFKSIQKNKPDIILSVWHSSFLIAAFKIAKKESIPFAIIIHDDWEEMINAQQWSRPILRRPLKQIFLGASKRICVSKSTAESFQRKYGNYPCEILPPMPSRQRWRPLRASQRKILRIAFFGELMGNIEVLKSVSAVLVGIGASLTFFSHGQGNDRKQLGTRPHVTDGGSLSAEELVQHLALNFDVVLIPQSFEPEHKYLVQSCFPSKISEACQIGLPILTIAPAYGTAYMWAREAMPHSLILNSLQPQMISSAILSLKNQQVWSNAQEAVLRAQRKFNPETLHKKLEYFLQDALTSA